MTSYPAIDIIMPVYNTEFYLERAIRSVVAQDYKSIRLLIVDDGSTDDSPEIARSFSDQYAFVEYYRKKNGGHGSACNYGMERIKADYFCFLDSDDFLDSDSVGRMAGYAVRFEPDLLIGNLRTWTGWNAYYDFKPLPYRDAVEIKSKSLMFENFANPQGRLYKSSLLENDDLEFIPGRMYADANFTPKCYYYAKRIVYVDDHFMNYENRRPTQTIFCRNEKMLDIVPVLDDMISFYESKMDYQQYYCDVYKFAFLLLINHFGIYLSISGFPVQRAFKQIHNMMSRHYGKNWLGIRKEFDIVWNDMPQFHMNRRYWVLKSLPRWISIPLLVRHARLPQLMDRIDRVLSFNLKQKMFRQVRKLMGV